jgi:hypothetical protein
MLYNMTLNTKYLIFFRSIVAQLSRSKYEETALPARNNLTLLVQDPSTQDFSFRILDFSL